VTAFTLVLGGGGVAGIAWELGLIAGLADEGVDLTAAETILGTSAGSTVAAQLTSGVPIAELYARQLAGVPYEISKSLSGVSLVRFLLAQLAPGSPQRASRRVAAMALKARVGTLAERRGVIEARLPNHEWPDRDLRIVAVDAATGAPRVITRGDGVALVDAVAASCAVPLVWPPVPLDGRRYIDGGIRSPLNLDLAPGTGPVVAIAPITMSFRKSTRVEEQRKALAPRQVHLVTMSESARAAQGRNSLDKSVVPAVALAGHTQGRAAAEELRGVLSR
jgi:NTE family protein